MSIFEPKEEIIIEPTREQVVRKEYNDLVKFNAQYLEDTKNYLKIAFNKVWSNPNATPEEMLAEAGNNAYLLFQVSSALQDLILSIDPTYVKMLPPVEVEFNQDGTVTIK
jgi:hypothetical protein